MDDSKILEMKHEAPELLERTSYIMEVTTLQACLQIKIFVPIVVLGSKVLG